jgi:hypothetical protein
MGRAKWHKIKLMEWKIESAKKPNHIGPFVNKEAAANLKEDFGQIIGLKRRGR